MGNNGPIVVSRNHTKYTTNTPPDAATSLLKRERNAERAHLRTHLTRRRDARAARLRPRGVTVLVLVWEATGRRVCLRAASTATWKESARARARTDLGAARHVPERELEGMLRCDGCEGGGELNPMDTSPTTERVSATRTGSSLCPQLLRACLWMDASVTYCGQWCCCHVVALTPSSDHVTLD